MPADAPRTVDPGVARRGGWLPAALLIPAVGLACGYLGAQLALAPVREALATRPPVVVQDVAAALRDLPSGKAGAAIAAQRATARRLAAGGVLVLDAQAVLAAPPDAFLPAGPGRDR